MEKRYTALRIIATLYKIAGVVIAILVVLAVIFTVVSQPLAIDFGYGRLSGTLGVILAILAAIVELIVGGLSALGVYAIGELLYVMINIEENTRFTALIMRDRIQNIPPVQPSQPIKQVQPAAVPPTQPTQTVQQVQPAAVPPTQPPVQSPMEPPAQPSSIEMPPPTVPPESQS